MNSIARLLAGSVAISLVSGCIGFIPVPVSYEWLDEKFQPFNPWAEDPSVSVLCQLTNFEPSDCQSKTVLELFQETEYIYPAGLDNRNLHNPGSILDVSVGYGARPIEGVDECFDLTSYIKRTSYDDLKSDSKFRIEFEPIEFLRFASFREVGYSYLSLKKILGTIDSLEIRTIDLLSVMELLSQKYLSFNRLCRDMFETPGHYFVSAALVAPGISFEFINKDDEKISLCDGKVSNYIKAIESNENWEISDACGLRLSSGHTIGVQQLIDFNKGDFADQRVAQTLTTYQRLIRGE